MISRRRWMAWIGLVLIVLLMPGCWDEVNLQDVSYVSAIGIDYKDGQYTIYAQMLNFSSIAKTDSPPGDGNQVWIGKATGNSVLMAVHALSRSSYLTLNLEHLKTIVVQERAMSQLTDILDGLNRHRASRYTTFIYGTKVPFEELFNTESFFFQSPLNSLMYLPSPHEEDYTFIKAQTMQSFVRQLKEPAECAMLPAMTASEAYWRHGKKPMNTQLIGGVYVVHDYDYKGYAPEEEIRGIRWASQSFERVFMTAERNGTSATIVITQSHLKLRAASLEKPERFELTLQIQGYVAEMDGEMSKLEIESSIQSDVTQEIESTYRYGVSRKLDLFGLEHHLYRYHNGYWKQKVKDTEWKPESSQLEVKVKMALSDSGKFELSGSGS